ncbi:MAG: hypothetical protein Q4G43_17835, partial [Mobilicoccus sp.]|nr:hypothetical protein [Mobilicoccus sp.]
GFYDRKAVTLTVTDLAQGEGAATYRTLTVTPEGENPERFELPGIQPGEVDQMADPAEVNG